MARDGSLTPADLIGKLDILRVECPKCGRAGQYRVDRLIREIGRDGKLTDWLSKIAGDCPRKRANNYQRRLRGVVPRSAEGALVAKRPTEDREWRVSIVRARLVYLGRVVAPDRDAAEAEAVEKFKLSDQQRTRLVLQEQL
jgi:hypothetical protein